MFLSIVVLVKLFNHFRIRRKCQNHMIESKLNWCGLRGTRFAGE